MLSFVPSGRHGAHGWARAVLILGAGTMTTAWLALWIALFRPSVNEPTLLPWPLQELVILGGGFLSWRLIVTPLGERWVRLFFTLAALLAALVTVWAVYYRAWVLLDPRWLETLLRAGAAPSAVRSSLLATAVAALVLWWAGGRIGASDLDGNDVSRFFRTGLAGLFAGLVVAAAGGAAGRLVGVLSSSVAFFFAAALVTLPVAQLVWVQERGKAAGARPPRLDRRWALTVGSAAAAVLLVALLISSSLSTALISVAISGLARLPDLLTTILTPLFLAGGYVVEALIWLFDALRGQPHAVHPTMPSLRTIAQLTHGQHGRGYLPLALTLTLRWVALVAVALVVLFIVSRAVTRFSGLRHDRPFDEERDSVWSREEAAAAWRALLGRLGARLRRSARRRTDDDMRRPPRTVREAYRRLLRRGAEIGHPRAVDETPQEYLGRLHRVPISDERDATFLTWAYMRVRYGEEAEQPADVEQAVHAWERFDRGLAAFPPGSGPSGPHSNGWHEPDTG